MTSADDDPQAGTEPSLIAWSAPDEPAEKAVRERLANAFATAAPAAFSRLAAQLTAEAAGTHGPGTLRGSIVAGSAAQAVTRLSSPGPDVVRAVAQSPRPAVLLFPGHGAQHVRMGVGLYGFEPVFTAAMDDFFRLFGPEGPRLREDWLSEQPEISIDEGTRGQPLLFAVDYAVARTVLAWGLRPAALLGYSVGELVAAHLAGVFDLADAARLMAGRSTTYRLVVPGGLLAVAASPRQLEPFTGAEVSLAAVNSPRQTMLGGPDPALAQVQRDLAAAGFVCRRVRIPQPFHTPFAAGAAAAFERFFAGVDLRPPGLPVYSSRSGAEVSPREAATPAFWAGQMAAPVRFGTALDAAAQDVGPALMTVECGPSQGLTSLVRRNRAVSRGGGEAVATLPPFRADPAADRRALLEAAAALWREGHLADLSAVRR
jgi:[acyl-carrier-protein] S-malonyltransferase